MSRASRSRPASSSAWAATQPARMPAESSALRSHSWASSCRVTDGDRRSTRRSQASMVPASTSVKRAKASTEGWSSDWPPRRMEATEAATAEQPTSTSASARSATTSGSRWRKPNWKRSSSGRPSSLVARRASQRVSRLKAEKRPSKRMAPEPLLMPQARPATAETADAASDQASTRSTSPPVVWITVHLPWGLATRPAYAGTAWWAGPCSDPGLAAEQPPCSPWHRVGLAGSPGGVARRC